MTCDAADLYLEALAAGDTVPADVQAHVAGCGRCQRQLTLAQEVERLLPLADPVPAPPGFTGALIARLHRERWRREQSLDRWFNVTIAAGLLCIVGGIWMLLNLSGLSAVVGQTTDAVLRGAAVVRAIVAPSLPTYGAAAVLLTATLALWWWAETASPRAPRHLGSSK